jgi:hypothetical protein
MIPFTLPVPIKQLLDGDLLVSFAKVIKLYTAGRPGYRQQKICQQQLTTLDLSTQRDREKGKAEAAHHMVTEARKGKGRGRPRTRFGTLLKKHKCREAMLWHVTCIRIIKVRSIIRHIVADHQLVTVTLIPTFNLTLTLTHLP